MVSCSKKETKNPKPKLQNNPKPISKQHGMSEAKSKPANVSNTQLAWLGE